MKNCDCCLKDSDRLHVYRDDHKRRLFLCGKCKNTMHPKLIDLDFRLRGNRKKPIVRKERIS
jgi:hypothetical protein